MDDTTLVRALLTGAADRVRPVGRPPSATGFAARRRRHRRTAFGSVGAVAAVALVAAGLTLVSTHGAHRSAASPTTTAPVNPAATAEAISHDKWTTLPNAPIGQRDSAASVWTGSQMLIWGGEAPPKQHPGEGDAVQVSVPVGDGAAYEPRKRTWTQLPVSPLSPRAGAASVWTGRSMFVWGGNGEGLGGDHRNDGALYTPADRAWTMLPPAPLPASADAQAVYIDGRVIVVTGPYYDVEPERVRAAVYDLASNSWSRLPTPAPIIGHTVYQYVAIGTGDTVRLLANWTNAAQTSAVQTSMQSGVDSYSLDVSAGRWTALGAAAKPVTTVNHVLSTGRALLIPPASQSGASSQTPQINLSHGVALDLADGATTAIPRGPLDALDPDYAWTGGAMLAVNTQPPPEAAHAGPIDRQGQAAVWDPNTGRWYPVPTSPLGGASRPVVVWTGTSLIVWAGFKRAHGGVQLG